MLTLAGVLTRSAPLFAQGNSVFSVMSELRTTENPTHSGAPSQIGKGPDSWPHPTPFTAPQPGQKFPRGVFPQSQGTSDAVPASGASPSLQRSGVYPPCQPRPERCRVEEGMLGACLHVL